MVVVFRDTQRFHSTEFTYFRTFLVEIKLVALLNH